MFALEADAEAGRAVREVGGSVVAIGSAAGVEVATPNAQVGFAVAPAAFVGWCIFVATVPIIQTPFKHVARHIAQ